MRFKWFLQQKKVILRRLLKGFLLKLRNLKPVCKTNVFCIGKGSKIDGLTDYTFKVKKVKLVASIYTLQASKICLFPVSTDFPLTSSI